MAAIVDFTYYTGTYRAGSTAVIGATEFPFFSKKAEKELGRQTFGRLSTAAVTDNIKDCICEIAEYMFQCEQAYSSAHGGVLTSYSNDGDSGSIDKSMFAEENRPKKIRSIVKSHLAGSDLLHGGVDLWRG